LVAPLLVGGLRRLMARALGMDRWPPLSRSVSLTSGIRHPANVQLRIGISRTMVGDEIGWGSPAASDHVSSQLGIRASSHSLGRAELGAINTSGAHGRAGIGHHRGSLGRRTKRRCIGRPTLGMNRVQETVVGDASQAQRSVVGDRTSNSETWINCNASQSLPLAQSLSFCVRMRTALAALSLLKLPSRHWRVGAALLEVIGYHCSQLASQWLDRHHPRAQASTCTTHPC